MGDVFKCLMSLVETLRPFVRYQNQMYHSGCFRGDNMTLKTATERRRNKRGHKCLRVSFS